MERLAALAQDENNGELMEALNDMQAQDMTNLFNTLSEKCFSRCVTTFRSRQLDRNENNCLEICAQRFMKHYQRIGMRFADENTQQQAQQQVQQQSQ